jgi:hypothetical protein
MKKSKTILVASSSMLAAGMAHGQTINGTIVTTTINQTVNASSSGVQFDLNDDGTPDYTVLFDGNNSVKPCVVGANSSTGYPGSFPNPIPLVFNELNMNPGNPTNNDDNGVAVMPIGTLISSSPITLGTNTLTVGDLGGDTHGKNEGYLYQNGETDLVGQWPPTQDTFGYVGLAMVNTSATPATTNYGWVYIELNYAAASPTLTVYNCGYENVAGSNILAGQEGPIKIPVIYIPPASQTNSWGTTVNMNVVALADPAPVYQWMAGAVGSGIYTNLPNAGEFSGVNTPTLIISNISSADQLDYVVSVSNTNDGNSRSNSGAGACSATYLRGLPGSIHRNGHRRCSNHQQLAKGWHEPPQWRSVFRCHDLQPSDLKCGACQFG